MLSYDQLECAVMKFVMESKQECFDAEELAAELDPQSSGEERENTLRRICNILDSCEFVHNYMFLGRRIQEKWSLNHKVF